MGSGFGSGSGPLSSSSGRRNGTLDFILHRTPLESISEELEEAEPDPIGVTSKLVVMHEPRRMMLRTRLQQLSFE